MSDNDGAYYGKADTGPKKFRRLMETLERMEKLVCLGRVEADSGAF